MERSMVPWYILEFIVLESAGSTVSLPFQCSKDGIEEEQVDGAAGEGCLIRWEMAAQILLLQTIPSLEGLLIAHLRDTSV